MSTVVPALLAVAGIAVVVVALLMRARERQTELARILDLPFGEQDVEAATTDLERQGALLRPAAALAHQALERLSWNERIGEELLRARLPLRPAEFALAALGAGIFGGIVAFLFTSQALIAIMAMVLLVWGSWGFVRSKAARRQRAFEMQLPEALSLIASSLEAGHTFMHSIEMMVQEAEAPLSEEFERVLAETRLGDPLLEAVDRMAQRLRIKDLLWVVQAIRIQQTVGGKLADLLVTLSEFMRAREEIRREVRVLTAEGRMSANVLAALPVVVFMVIKTLNPSYIDPMLRGGGLLALGGAALSVCIGIAMIRRMARIDV